MADIEPTNVNDRNWKVLIRPNRPVVQAGYDAKRKAKLVIEPLERRRKVRAKSKPARSKPPVTPRS